MTHICGVDEVDLEMTKKRRSRLPDGRQLLELSDFFKIFSDSTRLKILFALDGEDLCVCEIADVLEMSSSAVSHQLKTLRQSNLIKGIRRGKNIYYSLADAHVRDIIEKALEHVEE